MTDTAEERAREKRKQCAEIRGEIETWSERKKRMAFYQPPPEVVPLIDQTGEALGYCVAAPAPPQQHDRLSRQSVLTDTERESMEARAREWWDQMFRERDKIEDADPITYGTSIGGGMDMGTLKKAFIIVVTVAHREGMEEAAKVCAADGTEYGDELAAAIREKINP